MVRDTEKGVRYLEKTKEGGRVVTEDTKRGHLFGLGGLFYDGSYDYPLPLLGVYWVDLDASKRHDQVQVLFGGVLLAGSWNQPRLFGSPVDVGVDVFGIAIRGTDALFVGGEEDKTQRVKSRSFAAAFKAGVPLARHLKLTATLGETHRDFAADDAETSPGVRHPVEPLGHAPRGTARLGLARMGAHGPLCVEQAVAVGPVGLRGKPGLRPRQGRVHDVGRRAPEGLPPAALPAHPDVGRLPRLGQHGPLLEVHVRVLRRNVAARLPLGRAARRGSGHVEVRVRIRHRERLPPRGHLRGRARQGPGRGPRLGLLQRRGHLGRARWGRGRRSCASTPGRPSRAGTAARKASS